MKLRNAWLGLEEMPLGDVDWQYRIDLGDGVVCVRVAAGGPADRAGIKTGDFLISINGKSWDEYNDTIPNVGEPALLDLHRRDSPPLSFHFLHEGIPCRRQPRRRRLPMFLSGAEVDHLYRNKWFADLSLNPKIKDRAVRVAGLLAFKYYSRKTRDAYPSLATLAEDCDCSVSSIQRAVQNLYEYGLIRILSGSKKGGSNRYRLCHPAVPCGGIIPMRAGN